MIRTVLSLLLAAVLSVSSAAQEPKPPTCTASLWEPLAAEGPDESWAHDTASLVGYRSRSGDLETQYITADRLILSMSEFPSLRGRVDQPNANVKSIVFDAREIVVDMPLVFTSATVVFLGEQVTFTQRASIAFTDPPRAEGDGVKILAKQIDFANALNHPFVFVTTDPDWHAPSEGARRVLITGEIQPQPPAQPQAKQKWIRSLTLDDEYNPTATSQQVAAAFSLNTGRLAQTEYLKSLNDDMLWPQQTADKIARQFAMAPFDAQRREFLRAKVHALQTTLKNSRQNIALSVLIATGTALDTGVDNLGFHRYYVPRRDFTDFQKDFSALSAGLLNAMKQWNAAILDAHGGRSFDAAALGTLTGEYDKASNDEHNTETNISELMNRLVYAERDISGVNQQIEQQELVIEARRKDLEEKAETNRNIRLGTNVLVMAASFLPVSAPVAIAIGAGLAATGSAIGAHNEGQTVTGRSVVLSIPEAVAKSKDFNAKVANAKTQWDGAVANSNNLVKRQKELNSLNNPTDDQTNRATSARNDAAQKTGEAVGSFVRSLDELYKGVSVPEPTHLSLDEVEKSDTVLASYLAKVGEIRNGEATILGELDAARRKLKSIGDHRHELELQRTTLLASNLQNDKEISRREELAWTVRQTFLRNLAYNVAVLLRAYKYHTGQDLTGPIAANYFSTYYRLSRPPGPNNEGRHADEIFYGGSEKELKEALESQDKQLSQEITTLMTQVAQGYSSYLERIAQHEPLSEQHILNDKNAPEFIEAVNLELRRQVQSISEGGSSAPVPLLLPFVVQPSHTNAPEKLLDAIIDVTSANAQIMSTKSIQFSVLHPFVGRLQLGDRCFTVDMRRTDAIENVQRYTSSCEGATHCAHQPIEMRDIFKKENAALVPLPVDAQYFLEIRVRAVADPTPPTLEEIRIRLAYVR